MTRQDDLPVCILFPVVRVQCEKDPPKFDAHVKNLKNRLKK